MVVQHLLNYQYDVIDYLSPITGILDEKMTQAIKSFQQYELFRKNPSGMVDLPTWEMLVQMGRWNDAAAAHKPCDLLRPVIGASRQARVATRYKEASSSLSIINPGTFLKLYDLQFGMLGAAQRAGLARLIEYINEDQKIWDVGWCAYMLATVKHECKNKWEPIGEPGSVAWHPYGERPEPYTDTEGKSHANRYYGRGYIPLVGLSFYLRLGQYLGLGDDLAKNPDDALDPDIAYKVLSYVMRQGFHPLTPVSTYIDPDYSLWTYINATRCDYLGARNIIFYAQDRWGLYSGRDSAAIIQGYAEDLELLLRVSCSSSFSDSPYRGFEQDRNRYNAETRALVRSNLINVCCPDPLHPYRRPAENPCIPRI